MPYAPINELRTGLELVSDAVVIADAAGRVTFANPAAADLFGVARLAGTYLDTLFETSVESSEAHVAQALGGQPRDVVATVRAPDGERRAVLLRLAPAGAEGAKGGVVAAMRDVTDEFRARQSVAKAEARYRDVFESASDAIYTVDRNGAFTSVNAATCRMSGYEPNELIGRSLVPFLDPAELPMIVEHFTAAAHGEPRQYECHFAHKSGERILLSVTNTPIRAGAAGAPAGGADEVVGVLGIARDVTEQQRASAEREQLRRQLGQAQKLEAIGQLVSGVAHELNNPLAAVMAYAQLVLGNTTLSSDDRRALDTMLQETKRAARIVSNLLTFARQHQPDRSVTDVNQVVTDTLALRHYAMDEARIALDLELDPRVPLTWADGFGIQQVLLNLVSNAEQALQRWDGERRVVVRTWYAPPTICLSVADTGPGIPDDVSEQIFNPFFTTKGVGQGTGLGLSISDGIVREHGGRVRVEHTPGGGATLVVELPFVDPAHGFLAYAPAGAGTTAGDGADAGATDTLPSPGDRPAAHPQY